MIDIKDNFLPIREFEQMHSELMAWNFPWYASKVVNDSDQNADYNMQFTHLFYERYSPVDDTINILHPVLRIIQPISIFKIKANIMPNQGKVIEHGYHHDVTDSEFHPIKDHMKTSILYMNTNNGFTKFEDGTIIESVANRFVTFPNHTEHTGTTTSDSDYRLVINFNYA